jgi:alternate signal-mediated exported protein
MKKATKGALAAAAAGTLMVGGAGSLAFWTGTGTVAGTNISSGSITMGAETCTGTGLHGWQFADSGAFSASTSKIVPGDSISKVCTFSLALAGDNIGADLTLTNPATFTGGSTLATALGTPTATFAVDGATATQVTAAGTYAIKVTVTVAFPSSVTAVDTQSVSTSLNNLTVTATQKLV